MIFQWYSTSLCVSFQSIRLWVVMFLRFFLLTKYTTATVINNHYEKKDIFILSIFDFQFETHMLFEQYSLRQVISKINYHINKHNLNYHFMLYDRYVRNTKKIPTSFRTIIDKIMLIWLFAMGSKLILLLILV